MKKLRAESPHCEGAQPRSERVVTSERSIRRVPSKKDDRHRMSYPVTPALSADMTCREDAGWTPEQYWIYKMANMVQ